MSPPADDADPRGLIAEAYRIDGIGEAECRTIFLDWALGLPAEADVPRLARAMLERAEARPDHPMTRVLRSATEATGRPRRRGGRGRVSGAGQPPPPRGR